MAPTSPKNENRLKKPQRSRIELVRQEFFSGPLPHPETLAKYERVLPGAADRILTMAEQQAAHRQRNESQLIQSAINSEKIGMYFSFILTILFMLVGAYLIMHDKEVIGFLAFFSPSVFHAFNYVRAKKQEQQKHDQAEG